MRYGWINTNLLDMRAEPDHHSERVNQVRFGEAVHVLKSHSKFVRIRQFDGYSGWVDKNFVSPIGSRNDAFDYYDGQNCIVVSTQARLYNLSGESVPPYVLYYGTTLTINVSLSRVAANLESIDRQRGNKSLPYTGNKGQIRSVRLNMPGQPDIFVKSRNLRPIDDSNKTIVTGSRLVAEGRKFLGVPYLWGGVSPLGFDCSGFVQAIYRSHAIKLPRDTKDQIAIGCEVERESIKSGDLLFFNRHVALAVNRYRFIHASQGAGGVRIESLFGEDPDYRADLDREFVQARRVLL